MITTFQYLNKFGEVIKQEIFGSSTAIQYLDYLRTDYTFYNDVPKNVEFIKLVEEDGTIEMYFISPNISEDFKTWNIRRWVE